jgi:hypothetical protein
MIKYGFVLIVKKKLILKRVNYLDQHNNKQILIYIILEKNISKNDLAYDENNSFMIFSEKMIKSEED